MTALTDKITELRQLMTGYRGDARFTVADVILYNLALDVREQVDAVALLTQTPLARAAYANTRAALESAIDLCYLVNSETEYAPRGARARAFELFEGEHPASRESD